MQSLKQEINEATATLNKIAEARPTDVQVVQAEVKSAIAAVKQAEADLALSYVRAPIAGEILKIHTHPGETINSNGIVEIGGTDRMVVVAEILAEDISKVRVRQTATITSENNAFYRELQETVVEIGRQIGKDVLGSDPAADVDARVVEVKIGLTPEASKRVSGLTYAKVVVAINLFLYKLVIQTPKLMLRKIPLAWLQLKREKTRLVVALAGITFTDILMFMQLGFRDALFESNVKFHQNLKGEIVLTNPQSDALLSMESFFQRRLYQALAFKPVESVHPIYLGFVGWKNHQNRKLRQILVVGISPKKQVFDLPEI